MLRSFELRGERVTTIQSNTAEAAADFVEDDAVTVDACDHAQREVKA
jgi:hypothetical protein